jgi:hypothetical protein
LNTGGYYAECVGDFQGMTANGERRDAVRVAGGPVSEGDGVSRDAGPPRLAYIGLAIATVVAGLAVHLAGGRLDPAARDVIGDALWAAMMTWWISAAVPAAPIAGRGLGAVAVSFAVEFSQLLRTPFLDAVRRTVPGHLVLGSGFDPRDLAAYAVGVLVAALIDRALVGRRGPA